VKQHLLSDRAALQALVLLAGALGVGTTFALFFGGRRRSGTAVFELFAIVAVLTAAGSTAFLSVSLLHQNEAITLVGRSRKRQPCRPGDACCRRFGWRGRLAGRSPRHRLGGPGGAAALGAALRDGLCPGRESPRFVLPESASVPTGGGLVCWEKKDRSYHDLPGWLRLRDEAGSRWRDLTSGEARPPIGSTILVKVKVGVRVPGIRDQPTVRVSLLEPNRDGEPRVREIQANEDGVFDVTDLAIV
jgi:hypothetical protein